jgi:very-short-patch-repair endonuclease
MGDYTLDTTLMLKVLSRLAPQQAWTSDWLTANVRNKPDQRMILSSYIIEYKGQPGGYRTQHTWRIYTNNDREKVRLDQAVKSKTPGLIPTEQPQYQSSGSTDEPFTWNGLQLRSPAEQKIAEELEKRKILFFANARCRITTRIGITETKEADFLIYYKGNSRILEVDGQEYHQSAAKDHQRDRLFERNGIPCTRFTANECLNDPANVIDEFLELFDVTQFLSEVYKNESIKTGVSAEEKTTTIDINVNQKTAPSPRPVSPRPVKIVPDPDVVPF